VPKDEVTAYKLHSDRPKLCLNTPKLEVTATSSRDFTAPKLHFPAYRNHFYTPKLHFSVCKNHFYAQENGFYTPLNHLTARF
jgi:hypothetical protein